MEFIIKGINDYITEDKQFKEIYNLIKDFDDYLYNEAYLFEDVKYHDIGNTVRNAFKRSYGDSISTTKAVLGAGNKVAKSLGNFYRHSYNFIMKCIHFIASTISFILDAISSIPQTINRCIDKLGSLSETVIAKINGDIMLHITHKDIEYLYKSNGDRLSLMDNLLKFKGIAELLKDEKIWELTESQYNYKGKKVSSYALMFGYNLARKHKVVLKPMVGNKKSLENFGIIPTLELINAELKHITFNKSKINMSLDGNRSIYLQHPENNSNNSLIKITHNGKTDGFKYYLPALNRLISDLSYMKNELKNLSDTLTNKISAVFSYNPADLPEESQKIINKIVPCITNVFKFVSTILMYAKNDIDTVNKTADKILQVQNKS